MFGNLNNYIFRMYEMVLHEFPARLTDLVVRAFGKEPFALRFVRQFELVTSKHYSMIGCAIK